MNQSDQTVIKVFVGMANGVEHFENLLVEARADGTYRLLRSPKMASGLAREDTFRVDDLGDVLDVRSGLFDAYQVVMNGNFTKESLAELICLPESFGGTFDAHDECKAGLSIPKSADWRTFERALEAYSEKFGAIYGNSSDTPP
jgi:hypothetical protein